MKRSFFTIAALGLVLSFTSCKETTVEKTEETNVEVFETETEIETPAEVMESPVEMEIDTTTGAAE